MGTVTIVEIKDPITKMVIGNKTYYLTAQIFYAGVHFSVRKRIVDNCKWFLVNYLKKFPKYTVPVAITIEIHNKNTGVQDIDNKGYFWGKVALDQLVHMKKLVDDNVKYVTEIRYRYQYSDPMLVIKIEELPT